MLASSTKLAFIIILIVFQGLQMWGFRYLLKTARKSKSWWTSNFISLSKRKSLYSIHSFYLFSTSQDRSSAVPNGINPKLCDYIKESLKQNIQTHFADDPITIERLTSKFLSDLFSNPSISSNNQNLHETGMKINHYLQQSNKEILLEYDEGKLSFPQLLQSYQESVIAARQMFETISAHHYSIAQQDWQVVAEDTKALRDYSSAATSMGNRRWVKEGNDWMLNYAFTYFRHGNAVKHFMKLHDLKKYDTSHPYQNLVRDLFQMPTEDNQTTATSKIKKIQLLDVGSCYNPLSKNSNSGNFAITALDLYPSDPSVYQCDFLTLQIGPKDSLPIIEEITDENQIARKKIVQLPAHSFDVVSMSLVLSYLSHPQQREVMIRKARQLLRSALDTGIPHYNGLLLIVEKESIFNKMKQVDVLSSASNQLYSEWKRAIVAEGFDFAKYSLLSSEEGRRSHAFAFSTKPITNLAEYYNEQQQYNSITFGAASRLWIRQDFLNDHNHNSQTASPHQTETTQSLSSIPSSSSSSSSSRVTTSRPLSIQYYPIGIIGGGLGGSALALALQRKGIPFKLFEKDESFMARRQGYALTMQQGSIALRELGIVDQVKQLGTISTGHYSYDAQGHLIGAYGASVNHTRSRTTIASTEDFNKQRHNIHIPRQVLRNLLVSEIHPGHINWKKKLVSIEKQSPTPTSSDQTIVQALESIVDPEPIRLGFQDGSEELVSIVIGADGVFSRVRQLLKLNSNNNKSSDSSAPSIPTTDGSLITTAYDLQYLDLMVILGISPLKSSLDQQHYVQRQWVNGSTRVFTMPFDCNHVMWQLSYPLSESLALQLSSVEKRNDSEISSTGELLKQEALQRCFGWDPVLREILASTAVMNISGHPVYDRNPADFIVENPALSSRITLLGDAAHPMSPFKGQGANQALLDALSLSKALLSSDYVKPYRRKIAVALRDYEQDMISRTTVKVLKSREAAAYLHSQVALASGNITRAKAAEEALLLDRTSSSSNSRPTTTLQHCEKNTLLLTKTNTQ